MIEIFQQEFPEFYQILLKHNSAVIDDVLPPASIAQIDEIENCVEYRFQTPTRIF